MKKNRTEKLYRAERRNAWRLANRERQPGTLRTPWPRVEAKTSFWSYGRSKPRTGKNAFDERKQPASAE